MINPCYEIFLGEWSTCVLEFKSSSITSAMYAWSRFEECDKAQKTASHTSSSWSIRGSWCDFIDQDYYEIIELLYPE